MEGEENSYRIALNGVERPAQVPIGDATLTVRSSGLHQKVDAALKKAIKKQRQKQINPAFAAVLDIDAYRNDPAELDVANFIQECNSNNLGHAFAASKSVPANKAKKGKMTHARGPATIGHRCSRWPADRLFGKDRQQSGNLKAILGSATGEGYLF